MHARDPRPKDPAPRGAPRAPVKKRVNPDGRAHVASRTRRFRDPGKARSTRACVICPKLHSKVAGARGTGTGALKPNLKKIADVAHLGIF